MLSEKQEKVLKNGINIHKLKIGTIVYVATKNSLYKITKVLGDKFAVTVEGGKYFKLPTEVVFSGSTFGGTLMKVGWIGYGMNMEILTKEKVITTTAVRAARLIGEDWEFDMDWE